MYLLQNFVIGLNINLVDNLCLSNSPMLEFGLMESLGGLTIL